MATQILTPNIPSHTYSLLYLKHKVHFANAGLSYGCNKLKPHGAEEKVPPQPASLGGCSRSVGLGADLGADLQEAMGWMRHCSAAEVAETAPSPSELGEK